LRVCAQRIASMSVESQHLATPDREPTELLHERSLAERTSWIRVVLALANFAIIAFDPTVPPKGSPSDYAWAAAGGILFLCYALCIQRLLQTRRIRVPGYFNASPLLDIFFASVLLIASQGFSRPFNLWFVFAIMISGFGRSRTFPFVTAGLALLANVFIALLPHTHHLSLPIFAVRTGYLFAIAAVISFTTSHLLEDSRALAVIEDVGRRLALAITEEEVTRLLMDSIHASLPGASVRLNLADGRSLDAGPSPAAGHITPVVWGLKVGDEHLGTLLVHQRSTLTKGQRSLGPALCERAASSLLRIRLCGHLTRFAVSSERVRLADRLHDSYLQSLAAIDLRAEVARRLAGDSNVTLSAELDRIKDIARQSATQIRDIFDVATSPHPVGPAAVRRLLTERWPGEAEVDIPPDLSLSEDQWHAVEMVIREGLNNAKKHADASRIRLRMSRLPSGRVQCTLQNDGPRMNEPIQPGYGLSRLTSFLGDAGGTLRFEWLEAGGAALIAEFELKS
jgi:signal transduction histidine kinase